MPNGAGGHSMSHLEVTAAGGADHLIQVRNLSVHFRVNPTADEARRSRKLKVVEAVNNVTLDVERGEILSIVGESGSGKTTLGRTIIGLTKPTSGEIFIDGKLVDFDNQNDLRTLWKTVQIIFQDPYSAFNPLSSVRNVVETPLKKFKLTTTHEETSRKIDEVFARVGLNPSEIGDKKPSELSGGQRQRLAIARALASDPRVIVADEPASMLDVSLRAGLLDLLRKLNETLGVTILFITHDLAVAQYVSHRIAVMYRGEIIELGPSKEVIEHPSHPYTELLLQAAPKMGGITAWSTDMGTIIRDVEGTGDFKGCRFYPRCPLGINQCRGSRPDLLSTSSTKSVACFVRSGKGPN